MPGLTTVPTAIRSSSLDLNSTTTRLFTCGKTWRGSNLRMLQQQKVKYSTILILFWCFVMLYNKVFCNEKIEMYIYIKKKYGNVFRFFCENHKVLNKVGWQYFQRTNISLNASKVQGLCRPNSESQLIMANQKYLAFSVNLWHWHRQPFNYFIFSIWYPKQINSTPLFKI